MLRRRGERGFTLIETMIVLGTLTLTILGVIGAHVTCARLTQTNHETQIATQAVRSRMEEVCGTVIDQVVATYDSVASNDPAGTGTAPGGAYTTAGLAADSLGRRGTVEMPVDNTGAVREDLNIPALGMPRDLNGDGTIDAANHAADFRILPVLVRLRWKGISGNRELRLRTALAR